MFKTKYSDYVTVFTEPGERFKKERQLVVNDDGKEQLIVTGSTDLHGYIQSHKNSVDLDMILERFSNGDSTALEKVQGFYSDVSDLPMSFAEIMNMNKNGKELFDSLSPEIKAAYGNDYLAFICNPGLAVERMRPDSSDNVPVDVNGNVGSDGEVGSDDNKE